VPGAVFTIYEDVATALGLGGFEPMPNPLFSSCPAGFEGADVYVYHERGKTNVRYAAPLPQMETTNE
jgi:hypothetical protein